MKKDKKIYSKKMLSLVEELEHHVSFEFEKRGNNFFNVTDRKFLNEMPDNDYELMLLINALRRFRRKVK